MGRLPWSLTSLIAFEKATSGTEEPHEEEHEEEEEVAEVTGETDEEGAEAKQKASAKAIGKTKESNVKGKSKTARGKTKEKIEARLDFLARMYETKKNEQVDEDNIVEEEEV